MAHLYIGNPVCVCVVVGKLIGTGVKIFKRVFGFDCKGYGSLVNRSLLKITGKLGVSPGLPGNGDIVLGCFFSCIAAIRRIIGDRYRYL